MRRGQTNRRVASEPAPRVAGNGALERIDAAKRLVALGRRDRLERHHAIVISRQLAVGVALRPRERRPGSAAVAEQHQRLGRLIVESGESLLDRYRPKWR